MAARVLLIEDNQDFRDIMALVLKGAGYQLSMAVNGQEGLEAARREKPDLIVTDLMLPKLNGYEICTMLKQDVRYRAIPIVVLSATKVEGKDIELARECGANAFLVKTTAHQDLLKKIQELLAPAKS